MTRANASRSPTADPPAAHGSDALARLADACVKCGACLPVCPTYAHTRDEGDSPRGRISLVQGLLAGHLPPGPAISVHIEGCLHCRACERICPAQVAVTEVIRGGRARLRAAGQRPGWRVFLGRQAARLAWVRALLAAWPWPALRLAGPGRG